MLHPFPFFSTCLLIISLDIKHIFKILTLIIKSDLQFPMSQILSTQIKSEPWLTAFLPLKPMRVPAKEWGTPKSLGASSNFSQWILKRKWDLRTLSHIQIEWKSTDTKDTELRIYMYIRNCLIAFPAPPAKFYLQAEIKQDQFHVQELKWQLLKNCPINMMSF